MRCARSSKRDGAQFGPSDPDRASSDHARRHGARSELRAVTLRRSSAAHDPPVRMRSSWAHPPRPSSARRADCPGACAVSRRRLHEPDRRGVSAHGLVRSSRGALSGRGFSRSAAGGTSISPQATAPIRITACMSAVVRLRSAGAVRLQGAGRGYDRCPGRAQPFHWRADGEPAFGVAIGSGCPLQEPSGTHR